MRLVDFLILLLEAHGETLKRLAAFFGEERFFDMLENSDAGARPVLSANTLAFTSSGIANSSRSPYLELEGAVRESGLPEILEFHLWAYPYYRAFIESGVDLAAPLKDGNSGTALIEEAVTAAKEWIRLVPIPPVLSAQAETAASVPWIRFRSSAFKKMGLRPMGPVA